LKKIRDIGAWLGWVALTAIAIHGLFTDFNLSTAGKVYGACAATVSCLATTAWLADAGFFRRFRETASSRHSLLAGSMIVVVVFWILSWLILARGLPAAATSRYSEEQWMAASVARHSYAGARGSGPRYAALVELPGHDSPAWLRIGELEYRRLPETSHGLILVRKSWFGAHVLKVQAGAP
jgi:hypothetical protein